MSNSSVLKRAKILWLSNFAIALSPLFFTILILELDKYENVRELLMNRLSGYQQVIFILMALAVVFMIVLGYKLYTEITHFTSIGEGLSKDEIVATAGKLKSRLTHILKVAGFGFVLVTAIYLTGISYLYVFIFALPSVITYLFCSKIYYLRLS
jgi:hypothetical protein